jgi:glucose/arabinose dehydrogenase
MKFRRLALLAAIVALLTGCGVQGLPDPVPAPSVSVSRSPSATIEPDPAGPVQPVGTPTVVASGLNAPWSIVRLSSGSTLISERDTAIVKELEASGTLRDVGTVPGVVPNGEAGLLGLAVLEGKPNYLYAYLTAESDNRIVRFELKGSAGKYSLGDSLVILSGIAKAGNHDGGRIKFGPDGMLYATAGDGGDPNRAQDRASLNGKILRMTPKGLVPDDNPFPGSYVYSMGHRNPQGIAWDRNGQLWAAEFGQNTWDEFNRIRAGGNYGWPLVEGIGTDSRFINPVAQWATSEASPSGLLWTRDSFFLASLRGQRIWAIYPTPDVVSVTPWFVGDFGRIRDVAAGPNGTLWFITNNTDGRGDPREGDDKLWQVKLDVLAEG